MDQSARETIGGEENQAPIYLPALREDRSIETDGGEILGGRRADGKEPKVVRAGAVLARANETDGIARRRNLDAAKGAGRRKQLRRGWQRFWVRR